MNKHLKIALAAALTMAPAQAFAATGNVQFNGTVTHTCTINVNSAGAFAVSADFKEISAGLPGGAPGTATITTSGNGFKASIASMTLNKPAGDTTPESLGTLYVATGASTFTANHAFPPQNLNRGVTNLDIYMVAAKSGTNVFEAGAYSGTVVLLCE